MSIGNFPGATEAGCRTPEAGRGRCRRAAEAKLGDPATPQGTWEAAAGHLSSGNRAEGGGRERVPSDSARHTARSSEEDEAVPLPLPTLKPWSGWSSKARAADAQGREQETPHRTRFPRTPAPPARVAAPQACAHTRPGARHGPPPARGASGTFASPSPPHRPQTRARARRLPRLAPPRRTSPHPLDRAF